MNSLLNGYRVGAQCMPTPVCCHVVRHGHVADMTPGSLQRQPLVPAVVPRRRLWPPLAPVPARR